MQKFKPGDKIYNRNWPAKTYVIAAKNKTHYLFEDRGCMDIITVDSEYELDESNLNI